MEISYYEKMDLVYLRLYNFQIPVTDQYLYIYEETMRKIGPNSQVYLNDIRRIEKLISHVLSSFEIEKFLRNELETMLSNLAKLKTCFNKKKHI